MVGRFVYLETSREGRPQAQVKNWLSFGGQLPLLAAPAAVACSMEDEGSLDDLLTACGDIDDEPEDVPPPRVFSVFFALLAGWLASRSPGPRGTRGPFLWSERFF